MLLACKTLKFAKKLRRSFWTLPSTVRRSSPSFFAVWDSADSVMSLGKQAIGSWSKIKNSMKMEEAKYGVCWFFLILLALLPFLLRRESPRTTVRPRKWRRKKRKSNFVFYICLFISVRSLWSLLALRNKTTARHYSSSLSILCFGKYLESLSAFLFLFFSMYL